MLVLTRRRGEDIRIGSDITVSVLAIQGNRVRIGIDAPSGYHILRGELSDWMEPQPAADLEDSNLSMT